MRCHPSHCDNPKCFQLLPHVLCKRGGSTLTGNPALRVWTQAVPAVSHSIWPIELELVYHILKWPHQVQLANICNLLPRLCGGQSMESCKSMDSGPVLGQLSTDSVMWLRKDFCLLLLKTKSTLPLHWLCLLMSTSAKDSKNNLGLMKRVLKWALYSH